MLSPWGLNDLLKAVGADRNSATKLDHCGRGARGVCPGFTAKGHGGRLLAVVNSPITNAVINQDINSCCPKPSRVRRRHGCFGEMRRDSHSVDTFIVAEPFYRRRDHHRRPGLRQETKVRLDGIDAPELKGKCKSERRAAERARETLRYLANLHVQLTQIHHGKYAGRVIARVLTEDGLDIAAHLIAKGLARDYGGGKRRGWCD